MQLLRLLLPQQLKWSVLSCNLWSHGCLYGTEWPPAPVPHAGTPLHSLGTHQPPAAPFRLSGLWLDLGALWSCIWWQYLDCFASANERESKHFRRFTDIGIRWHTNLRLTMTVFMQSLENSTQIIWELKMNVSEHFHSRRTILASC